MIRSAALSAILMLALAACSSIRESEPARTSTEQLLFSTAADRAAEQLALDVAPGIKVFVDSAFVEGTDSKYLVSAIRSRVLRSGGALVDGKAAAELVVEPRVGALSVDRRRNLVGTPSFGVPIPLAGDLRIPEIALFKRDTQQGVVMIAATGYDPKSGALVQSHAPVYGFSHKTEWVVLILFSWTTNDLMPEEAKPDWVGR